MFVNKRTQLKEKWHKQHLKPHTHSLAPSYRVSSEVKAVRLRHDIYNLASRPL